MNDIIEAYIDFNTSLNTTDEYVKNTFLRNNGIQSIIDNYNGENKELLAYYKSMIDAQIQYNAIIINLYGAYERYVRSIAKYYLLELLKHCTSIEGVPEKICKSYRKNLGEFLSNPNRFNNANLNQKESVKNYLMFLDSNFDNADIELLLSRSGNLKIEQLRTLLTDIGLLEDKKLSDSIFLENYYLKNDIYDKTDFDRKKSRKENDLFLPLDQLVASRNKVAHTGEDNERISSTLLRETTIPFLHTVSRIILDVIINSLASFIQEMHIFTVINVFDNHILCINNQGFNVRTGDIIVYKHNGKLKNAIVTEIQINHEKVVDTGSDTVDVGLNLDNTICADDEIICILNR
ncbi:MAG: hypothetical protein IJT65_05380 [Eubacterium sp.]|nr:hypothetical protein [Eubacterium sp.]